MDFELPEDIALLKKTVRDFCEKHVKDQAREWDRTETFPMATVRELGKLGLLGIRIPEEFGGAGMGSLAVAVVVEEIARYDGSLALTVGISASLNLSSSRATRFCRRSECSTRSRKDSGRSFQPGAARSTLKPSRRTLLFSDRT